MGRFTHGAGVVYAHYLVDDEVMTLNTRDTADGPCWVVMSDDDGDYIVDKETFSDVFEPVDVRAFEEWREAGNDLTESQARLLDGADF